MKAIARRSGKWWAIEVPDQPGVFSQAKRLEQVPEMAADALSAWLERSVPPDEIDVEVHPGDELEAAIERAREAKARAETASRDSFTATRLAVKRSLDAGLPLRDVGALLHVSHQRIAAIARELDEKDQTSPANP